MVDATSVFDITTLIKVLCSCTVYLHNLLVEQVFHVMVEVGNDVRIPKLSLLVKNDSDGKEFKVEHKIGFSNLIKKYF